MVTAFSNVQDRRQRRRRPLKVSVMLLTLISKNFPGNRFTTYGSKTLYVVATTSDWLHIAKLVLRTAILEGGALRNEDNNLVTSINEAEAAIA